MVSFVGLIAGVSQKLGFSYSQDARCQGGRVFNNILEMLADGGQTPSQHARVVFESETNFEDAVKAFSDAPLVDPVYYIIGGATSGQGAVITRLRSRAADVWRLTDVTKDPDGWFRLQTNYDHWKSVPAYDDRRDPGIANMKALGQNNVTKDGMWSVLLTWPTFNDHTDYSSVMIPADGTFDTAVWVDDAPLGDADCATAYADQASCDADATCSWCVSAAVPSACKEMADAKQLPPAVFQCDGV